MVIFVEWIMSLKLREAKSLAPVYHIRDSIPHQLSLAPRPGLTMHGFENLPMNKFYFPLFPFFIFNPSTHVEEW